MAVLERGKPDLGLFETLESNCTEGFVQRCGEAHERRLCRDAEPRLEGRIPRTGERL